MLIRDNLPEKLKGNLPAPNAEIELNAIDSISDDTLQEKVLSYFATLHSTRRLVNPVRSAQATRLLRSCFPNLVAAARKARTQFGEQAALEAAQKTASLARLVAAIATATHGGVEADVHGPLIMVQALLADWYAVDEGTTFDATLALQSQLANTDIGPLPASYLRPPFPTVYVRWQGEPTPIFEEHVACEGAYIFQRQRREGVHDLFLALASSREGSPSTYHMTMTVTLVDDDELSNLREAFLNKTDQAFLKDEIADYARRMAAEGKPVDVEELMQPVDVGAEVFAGQLETLSKILFYLNSTAVRGETPGEAFKHRTAPPESVRRAYVGGRLPIIIGPVHAPQTPTFQPTGREMPVHWRRGHFRHVRHGEGRQLSKLMYFEPVMVNADKLGDSQEPSKKTYRLAAPRNPKP